MSFKRTLAKGVMALINKYNYEEAVQILKGYGMDGNAMLMDLIAHMFFRQNLDLENSRKCAAGISNIDLFPVKETKPLEICEYYNVLKNLQKTSHLTDFVLRLNPLVTELQSLFLINCLGFDVKNITEEKTRYGREKKKNTVIERVVSRQKITAVNPDLLDYIDQSYSGYYRDTHINIRLQNCIIRYLSA